MLPCDCKAHEKKHLFSSPVKKGVKRMTEKEWLEFGYEKKIIDEVDYVNCEIFERCYIE